MHDRAVRRVVAAQREKLLRLRRKPALQQQLLAILPRERELLHQLVPGVRGLALRLRLRRAHALGLQVCILQKMALGRLCRSAWRVGFVVFCAVEEMWHLVGHRELQVFARRVLLRKALDHREESDLAVSRRRIIRLALRLPASEPPPAVLVLHLPLARLRVALGAADLRLHPKPLAELLRQLRQRQRDPRAVPDFRIVVVVAAHAKIQSVRFGASASASRAESADVGALVSSFGSGLGCVRGGGCGPALAR